MAQRTSECFFAHKQKTKSFYCYQFYFINVRIATFLASKWSLLLKIFFRRTAWQPWPKFGYRKVTASGESKKKLSPEIVQWQNGRKTEKKVDIQKGISKKEFKFPP